MSDSEYEEEEFLVYADLKNQLLPKEINDSTSIKIIGIESKNPVAEINGNMFKGTYDIAMGTNVFFEKDTNAVPADPLYEVSCKHKYKYYGKTNKIINFQRMYVERKVPEPPTNTDKEAETAVGGEAASAERLKISVTYEEAIKQFPVSDLNLGEKK